ncbi:hypothetical protein JTE90_027329 [Oedothorax gibbosus]|uniref:Uncharacterized protein n=1 Tax=Oedothorax gibbosus TaxID=931172 RepID=A0AAV6W418_9ARAC|nr:hypothetical protein JTE90_027329 [Oedothorax gibbosus]
MFVNPVNQSNTRPPPYSRRACNIVELDVTGLNISMVNIQQDDSSFVNAFLQNYCPNYAIEICFRFLVAVQDTDVLYSAGKARHQKGT